jgi:small subunit ribosomal protein S15
MITKDKKSEVLKGVQISKNDTGSSSVQVAILTERIKELTEHLATNKHDFMARRGLLQMVGQRRRLLNYISAKNSEDYLALIKKLGIRR